MPKRPSFQRAPRLRPEFPSGEAEIPAPPQLPTKSETSLFPVLVPGVFAVGMMVATIMASTSASPLYAVLSGGFMLASSFVSLHNYYNQKKRYERAVAERETKYRALLQRKREQLEGQREQQRRSALQSDPDPRECLARVERRDRRLWERSPKDDDFLSLRLGLGARPFGITVKVPRLDEMNVDPLIEAAQALQAGFTLVGEAPVQLPLLKAGAVGIAGPRSQVLSAVRALCVQIATHHSPDEVKIVAIYPKEEASEWEWLRWLPHVWTDDHQRRYLADSKDTAHDLLTSPHLYDVLSRREMAISPGSPPESQRTLPFFVFLLADPRLVENQRIVNAVYAHGPLLGALPVFLAADYSVLPQNCKAVADLARDQATLIQPGLTPAQTRLLPDVVDLGWAEQFARAMAPIRLQGTLGVTKIPESVSLLSLLGADSVDALDAVARWESSAPVRTLAVPIGMRSGGQPMWLDLHEKGHGPHGLVAGMTRSGKTAFLSAFIAICAACYHPHEVSFVAIDYKGGDLVRDILDLPHLLGVITNLEAGLATRALLALKGEVERRQHLFNQAGVGNIYDYQRRRRSGEALTPLPHLVIVSDEFAELKKEQPDFIRELVSTARVGGSLGIHLILATQQPSGIVDDQIWGNARFRMSFRFGKTEDSQAVLKRPDAAGITQSGRAILQVGANEIYEMFQAAWGGTAYAPGGLGSDKPSEIREVLLNGARVDLGISSKAQAPVSSRTQLQALVQRLKDAASQKGIARLQGPWLEPLPTHLTLDRRVFQKGGWDGHSWTPQQTWLEPVVGLIDDPRHQFQGPLALKLGEEGHLAVYGVPGSGKTTFLQTLITSIVRTHTPEEVNLYLLDFGGRMLTMFEPLPHVGGVVLSDDEERLRRLLAFLLRELELRKDRFSKAGVGTLKEYRTATGAAVPAIVIVLDNYNAFIGAYMEAEESLAQIGREGGNLGIHLVLTATSPMTVRQKTSQSVTLSVAFELAERSDYSSCVGRIELEPAKVAGRGLLKGSPPLEFQTALPAGGATEAERTAALKLLFAEMDNAWTGARARPIPVLPDVVPLESLVPPGDSWALPPNDGSLAVPLGLEVEILEPVYVDLNEGPHFLITGPEECGKTWLMQTWLLALAERFSKERLQMYLVNFGRSDLLELQSLPHVRAHISDDDHLSAALAELEQEFKERRRALDEARCVSGAQFDEQSFSARYPALVMAIDDVDAFLANAQDVTKQKIDTLRKTRPLRFHLIVAGASSDVSRLSSETVVKAVKEMQCGFVLGSTEYEDRSLLNLKIPADEQNKVLPQGQGYFTRRRRQCKIKVATANAGVVTLSEWVERLRRRAGEKQTTG